MSRRSVTILTMAVLIAWAVHGRADEKPARAPAQTGAITGLVVDLQGRPVAGAAVWGVSYQEKFGPTRSGADGRFRLPDLKFDKPVTVWADAPGLARASRRRPHLPRQGPRPRPAHAPTRHPDARPRRRCTGQTGRRGRHQARPLPPPARPHDHLAGDRMDVQRRRRRPLRHAPAPRRQRPFLPQRTAARSAPSSSKKAEPGTPVVDLGDITLPDEMPVAGIVTDSEGKPAPGVEIIPDYDWQNAAKDRQGRPVHCPRRRQGPQESSAFGRTTTSPPSRSTSPPARLT